LVILTFLVLTGCGKPISQLDQQMSALKNALDRPEARSDAMMSGTNLFTNSIGMELSKIPAGGFMMGNPDPTRFGPYSRGEGPQHQVEITRGYWMGRHEVTVGQFREFARRSGYLTECERKSMQANGLNLETGEVYSSPEWTWRTPGYIQEDSHPVVCVTWRDAQAFCEWLSRQEGRTYRLPTEAEWEYACRAGTETLFWTGDWPATLEGAANLADTALLEVYQKAEGCSPWHDGFAFTAPAGHYTANFFGLYDMHGNVGEWCQDWYSSNYYEFSLMKDPTGPQQPTIWRVVRGASWYNGPMSSRSSGRHDGIATACSTTNGFRLVMDVESDEESDRKDVWAPPLSDRPRS